MSPTDQADTTNSFFEARGRILKLRTLYSHETASKAYDSCFKYVLPVVTGYVVALDR
jgi:hypothetical protein